METAIDLKLRERKIVQILRLSCFYEFQLFQRKLGSDTTQHPSFVLTRFDSQNK
jgi:hypothetical protein